MKKMMMTLTVLLMMAVSAQAMSYAQAREQALFLTDKMAYELNLTDAQYEAAYEINLDYLMSVNSYNDLYSVYWERRNLDLSYVLLDWQYNAFCAASYFFRPLTWANGIWHFGIYARYPYRDYFYFGRPHFYATYRGGHSWHMNGGHSWYHGRAIAPAPRGNQGHFGMRDGFRRGDYGRPSGNSGRGGQMGNRGYNSRPNDGGYSNGNRGNGNYGNGNRGNGSYNNGNRGNNNGDMSGNRGFGGNRNSSTRTTVTRPNSSSSTRPSTGSNFSGNRNSSPAQTFTPRTGSSSSSSSRSFGGSPSRSYSGNSGSTRSFGSSSHSSGSQSGGHFGGRR